MNAAGIADLLEVTTEDVRDWTRTPGSADALSDLVALLQRKLADGRVASVVRRRADAFGGASLLDWIAHGRVAEALEVTRGGFEFDSPA